MRFLPSALRPALRAAALRTAGAKPGASFEVQNSGKSKLEKRFFRIVEEGSKMLRLMAVASDRDDPPPSSRYSLRISRDGVRSFSPYRWLDVFT